jgi:hypothetical protein
MPALPPPAAFGLDDTTHFPAAHADSGDADQHLEPAGQRGRNNYFNVGFFARAKAKTGSFSFYAVIRYNGVTA